MERKILLFGPAEIGKILALRSVALAFESELCTFGAGDWKTPLGVLAGLDPSGAPDKTALPGGRMLVLCGLDTAVEALLPELAKAGFGPGCPKAVLTEYNRRWSAGRLYRELQREEEAIRKGRRP